MSGLLKHEMAEGREIIAANAAICQKGESPNRVGPVVKSSRKQSRAALRSRQSLVTGSANTIRAALIYQRALPASKALLQGADVEDQGSSSQCSAPRD